MGSWGNLGGKMSAFTLEDCPSFLELGKVRVLYLEKKKKKKGKSTRARFQDGTELCVILQMGTMHWGLKVTK